MTVLFILSALCGVTAQETDENGRSGVYAGIVNDYLLTYGHVETDDRGGVIFDQSEKTFNGVIYFEQIDFDRNQSPYLVIFLTEGRYRIAACHVWSYREGKAERIAVIDKKIPVTGDRSGEFGIGMKDGEKYITYTDYRNHQPEQTDYYIASKGEFLQFISEPEGVAVIGVADFGRGYFHPGIDASNGNRQLFHAFDELKRTVAGTSKYPNASAALEAEPLNRLRESITKTCSNASEIKEVTNLYSLGNNFYYALFATDAALYNDVIFRYTDQMEEPFLILDVRLDTIPFIDTELGALKNGFEQGGEAGNAAAEPLVPDDNSTEESNTEITPKPEKASHRSIPSAVYVFVAIFLVCLICFVKLIIGFFR